MTSARNTQHMDYSSPMLNMSHNPAGLKIQGAASAAFATTNTLNYSIDGVFKSKAAVASQSLLTNSLNGDTGKVYGVGDITIPVASTAYYLIVVDAAGNVKNIAGVRKGNNGVYAFSGQMPDYPEGYAPVGFIKIVTTNAAFIPGTTALDAAGLTVTFADVSIGGMNLTP